MTGAAFILYGFTRTAAFRACGYALKLPERGALHGMHLPRAAALIAGFFLASWLCAAVLAMLASYGLCEFYFLLCAECRFFKTYHDILSLYHR